MLGSSSDLIYNPNVLKNPKEGKENKVLYYELLEEQVGGFNRKGEEERKKEFEYLPNKRKFKQKETTFSTPKVVVKRNDPNIVSSTKPEEKKGLIYKTELIDPFDNNYKTKTEICPLEHTFSYDQGYLKYINSLREKGTQLKTKSDAANLLRTQYQQFIQTTPEFKDNSHMDKRAKQAVVRPYLNELYGRLGGKLFDRLLERDANKPKIDTTKPAVPQPGRRDPVADGRDKQGGDRDGKDRDKGRDGRDVTPDKTQDQDKQDIRDRLPNAYKKPTIDLPIPTPGQPRNKGVTSILRPKGSKSRRPGSRVMFDLIKKDIRVISPKRKIQFDWEFLPPQDNSKDPEQEDFLRNLDKKRFKDEMEMKTNPMSRDRNLNVKVGDPRVKPLGDESLNRRDNEGDDVVKQKTPEAQAPMDTNKMKQLRKAIEDNRCTKAEWQTYRKEFKDLKNLSEGVMVKKYGRKNLFRADERRFFFVENFSKFTWSKPGLTKYDKLNSVAEIEGIKLGKQTENLQRFTTAKEENCMSIIMPDRTVDLEFANRGDLQKVYQGFKFFVKLSRRFKANLYLYESLNDDFNLQIFDEVEKNLMEKGVKLSPPGSRSPVRK